MRCRLLIMRPVLRSGDGCARSWRRGREAHIRGMGRREAEEAVHPASEPFLDVLGVEFAQKEVLGDGKGDDCVERPREQVDGEICRRRGEFAQPQRLVVFW